MDGKQDVFQQITLSGCKMWSSAASKTFNLNIVITKNSSAVVTVANFWVNPTGYSGDFHVGFEQFERETDYILPPRLFLP